jgi:hypothetical protein
MRVVCANVPRWPRYAVRSPLPPCRAFPRSSPPPPPPSALVPSLPRSLWCLSVISDLSLQLRKLRLVLLRLRRTGPLRRAGAYCGVFVCVVAWHVVALHLLTRSSYGWVQAGCAPPPVAGAGRMAPRSPPPRAAYVSSPIAAPGGGGGGGGGRGGPPCSNLNVAVQFVRSLGIKVDAFFDFSAGATMCFCHTCARARGEAPVYARGEPPRKCVMPIGWARVGMKLPPHAHGSDIMRTYHVAYHGTSMSALVPVLKTGRLAKAGDVVHGGARLGVRDGHIPAPGYRLCVPPLAVCTALPVLDVCVSLRAAGRACVRVCVCVRVSSRQQPAHRAARALQPRADLPVAGAGVLVDGGVRVVREVSVLVSAAECTPREVDVLTCGGGADG